MNNNNKLIKNLVNRLKASMSEAKRILDKDEKSLSDMYFIKCFCENFISLGRLTQVMSDEELRQNNIKERIPENLIQDFRRQLILVDAYIVYC